MNREMDWKKFLILYIPMAIVMIIFSRIAPDWVRAHTTLYYVLLVALAFVAEQISRIWAKKEDEKNKKDGK